MRARKMPLRGALAVAVLLAGVLTASATLLREPVTMNSMVRWSTSIFVGKVISMEPAMFPGRQLVLTHVVIECQEPDVKGSLGVVGQRITVTQLGGTLGDITTSIPDSPRLAVGKRAVFFLEEKTGGAVVIAGMSAGVVDIKSDPDTGTDMVEAAWPVNTYGKVTVGDVEKNAKLARKSTATFLEDVKEVVKLEAERSKAQAERERKAKEEKEKDEGGR